MVQRRLAQTKGSAYYVTLNKLELLGSTPSSPSYKLRYINSEQKILKKNYKQKSLTYPDYIPQQLPFSTRKTSIFICKSDKMFCSPNFGRSNVERYARISKKPVKCGLT